jgi:hypothetical protein
MVLSSPSPREGGEGVTVAEEEDEDDPVEVIPVLDSPPRPAPRQMARIQGSVQRRPTRTLAPRSEAREPKGGGVNRDHIRGVAVATTTVERRLEHRNTTATTAARTHCCYLTAATPEPHQGPNPPLIHPPRKP